MFEYRYLSPTWDGEKIGHLECVKNIESVADAINFLEGPDFNSVTVTKTLCDLAEHFDRDDFWSLFEPTWSRCDNTYEFKARIQRLLRKNAPAPENEFYTSLPDRFRVYRGSDRTGVRGLSWTTSKDVAIAFSRGHRNIRFPNPVVASTFVNKGRQVLFATNDREEQEVMLDLRHVNNIEIESAFF